MATIQSLDAQYCSSYLYKLTETMLSLKNTEKNRVASLKNEKEKKSKEDNSIHISNERTE